MRSDYTPPEAKPVLQGHGVQKNLNNLNKSLTEGLMKKITPHIDMRTKIVYSFSCEVHKGGGDIAPHYKTKGSDGTLTSIAEIRQFIEQCEQQRLDLEDHEFWFKAYLPAERTIETVGSYGGKVVFDHVQIKIIASNEPLLGCGPLPDWLRKKRCIYAVDTFDDNLCIWRCLAIYKRRDMNRGRACLKGSFKFSSGVLR